MFNIINEDNNHQQVEILIVDDTPENLRLLANILKQRGYQTSTFLDGELALEYLEEFSPDLIFLDIKMPNMDGYQVCEKIKANHRHHDTPIIFISSANEVLNRVKAFQIGGVDYIAKPFYVEEVLARVDSHLQLHDLRKMLQQKNYVQAQQLAQQNHQLQQMNQALEQANQQLENYSQTLEAKVAQKTTELKIAQQQMIAQEKLASLGVLTSGIAHELRNPLNFVNNYAEGSVELIEEVCAEMEEQTTKIESADFDNITDILRELKENSLAIHHQGQRAAEIIDTMMQHASIGNNQKHLTNINELLDEAVKLVSKSKKINYHNFQVTVHTNYDKNIPPLELVISAISRAFTNLIANAYDALKQKQEQEEFTPKLWITTQNLSSAVEIKIRDNAMGIPTEIANKIFEPFFTTKAPKQGTGLGLSLTHDIIVGQHGGTLNVDSQLGVYTEFIITLPY